MIMKTTSLQAENIRYTIHSATFEEATGFKFYTLVMNEPSKMYMAIPIITITFCILNVELKLQKAVLRLIYWMTFRLPQGNKNING